MTPDVRLRRVGSAALLSCGIVLGMLGGCAQSPTPSPVVQSTPSSVPTATTPPLSGTLRLWMTPIDRIDPLRSKDDAFLDVASLVYEPLFSLDQEDSPIPRLCATTDRSQDGLTWNLTLRPAVFHDGTSFDAADAVSSARLWLEQGSGPLHDALAALSPVFDILDGTKVRIRLSTPETNLTWLLRFPVIPSESADNASSDPLVPVPGTGAFRIVGYVKGIGLDLERVEPSPGKVSSITVREYADLASAMEAFHSDAIDILPLDEESYRIFELRKGVRIVRCNGSHLVYAILGTLKTRTLSDATARGEILSRLPRLFDSDEFQEEFCVFSSARGLTHGFETRVFGASPSPTEPEPTVPETSPTWKTNLEVLAAKGSFEAEVASRIVSDLKSRGIPAVLRTLQEPECVDALLNGRYDIAIRPLPLPVVPGAPVLDSMVYRRGSPYPFPLIRSEGILVGPRVYGNPIPCASEIYRGIEETWVWSGS